MKILHTPPDWNSAPREAWQDWQLWKLRSYLSARVLPFSTHYRRLFEEHGITPASLQSWDDWQKVPFTCKSQLTVPREQMREFVLMPDEAVLRREPSMWVQALFHGRAGAKAHAEHEFRPVLMTSTTGRSSEPVPFLFTKHDIANLEKAGHRIMEAGRSRPDFRHVNLFPYAPHLAFWQSHYAGMAFGTFMVSSGGGKTLGTEGNIGLIDRVQPEVIIGMPTFIYHVLREALQMNKRWPNIKRLVLGGEKVAEGLRAKLLDLATALGSSDASVLSTYGFTEAKMAFPECAVPSGVDSTGYHLSPDLVYVELIDPKTGEPVGDGHAGEIVFTPLDARGTVVMRYRTGDIAEGGLSWEKCPHCGRTCPRLKGPISRVSEVKELHLDKVKGTLVNFNLLEHLLDDQKGVAAWQLEICKRDDDPLGLDEIILHLAPETGVNARELARIVTQRLSEASELRPNDIQFHTVSEMRDILGIGRLLKEEKIKDRRGKKESATGMASSNPSAERNT